MTTVRKAMTGDVEAFTELVRRYQDLAFGYALALLGDHHRAQDATQEAFLAAFSALDRLEKEDAFPAWLRGIVRHRCFRVLRARDLGLLPMDAEPADAESAPWRDASQRERRAVVLAAVRRLPRRLREVISLYYLKDCSQNEVAAFLDLPLTTVNNRLHQARNLLKKGMFAMAAETLKDPALPDDFAERIGTILRVEGPVIEARFDADAAPDVFDALAVAGGEPNLRVAQVLDEGVVRCLVAGETDELKPGMNVANRTAVRGTYAAPVTTDEDLKGCVETLGRARADAPTMVETGIKPVDLFCPLPADGNVGLFGTSRTGKMVMALELQKRLAESDEVRLFYLADRSEPALVRDLRADGEELPGGLQTVWLLSGRATDPEYAARTDVFDATVYCSPLLGVQGIWPATDPFHSASRVAVDERHARVAARAREHLARAKELMTDAKALEYLACRAFAAARRRLAEFRAQRKLTDEERVLVERARRVERFLTTPFLVAEDFTKTHGRVVPLEQTLAGVEAILDGEYDHVAEESFVFVGTIDEVRG